MRVLLAPLSSIFTCVCEGQVRLVQVWNRARLLHGPRGLTLHLERGEREGHRCMRIPGAGMKAIGGRRADVPKR